MTRGLGNVARSLSGVWRGAPAANLALKRPLDAKMYTSVRLKAGTNTI